MEESKAILSTFCNQFYKVYCYLDSRITNKLSTSGVITRPTTSNGLWCLFLVPSIFILYMCSIHVTLPYKLTAFLSMGITFYCILFILFLSLSDIVLKITIHSGLMVSALVATLLIYIFLEKGLLLSLTLTLPSVYVFSVLLRKSLVDCPKTFSFGEAMVVAQGIVILISLGTSNVLLDSGKKLHFIDVAVNTVLSTVVIIVTSLYILPDNRRDLKSLAYIVASGAIFILVVLHAVLGVDCLTTILRFIFMDQTRMRLFFFWLTLVFIAAIFIMIRTKAEAKANTVTRKVFHILASLVFLSGLLFDVDLTRFAAGVAFGGLIFTEALRKSRIEPISSHLESSFQVYSDEKDCGMFAMTPIYLFTGLACPLVLVPDYSSHRLELLSGVLSIGVGDTAASFFGSIYGRNKWSGTNKTVEGTIFNVLSQVTLVYVLHSFGLLSVHNGLLRVAIVAVITSLVEAKTDQVDNLILPLVTILSFQFTSILS